MTSRLGFTVAICSHCLDTTVIDLDAAIAMGDHLPVESAIWFTVLPPGSRVLDGTSLRNSVQDALRMAELPLPKTLREQLGAEAL